MVDVCPSMSEHVARDTIRTAHMEIRWANLETRSAWAVVELSKRPSRGERVGGSRPSDLLVETMSLTGQTPRSLMN